LAPVRTASHIGEADPGVLIPVASRDANLSRQSSVAHSSYGAYNSVLVEMET
jgi:hypothetical protein